MRLSRREVLAAAIGVTAGCTRGANSETPAAETTTTAPGAAATSTEAAQGPEILDLSPAPPDRMPAVQFSLGVASRLHATDSAVIWRRLDPRVGPVDTVDWEVTSSDTFATLARSGRAAVSASDDYCVKVLVDGLVELPASVARRGSVAATVTETVAPLGRGCGTDRARYSTSSSLQGGDSGPS